jgi:diketogulonate reductase-like aldo/keto reductase
VAWRRQVSDYKDNRAPAVGAEEAMAMILEETYTLANGVEIPRLGLGTWLISNGAVVQAVKDALTIGYRHIDTARAYGNEEGVGEAIRAAGVSRDEVFVTSKLAAEVKSYEQAVTAIDESLEAIGFDQLDLMIIHSPQPWQEFGGDDRYFDGNREAWTALEEAYEAGKLHAIGVSNFEREDIDNILDVCTVKPMVNQILAHISQTPHDLIRYSQEQGMLVEAYSPIAHGELLKNEQVRKIAESYDVTVPQLSIRYTLQLGLLPLPKTTNREHMKSNADVDFEISAGDMETLKNVSEIGDYGEHSRFPVFGGTRK